MTKPIACKPVESHDRPSDRYDNIKANNQINQI